MALLDRTLHGLHWLGGRLATRLLTSFEYKPLELQRHIRLLNIHPGSLSDPLSCHLTDVDLDSFPDYEAISYVWGDDNLSHSIRCHEKRLDVTKSLHEVLVRVRLSHRPRIIWIDGVCINQQDPQERGHQVRMMGDIYKRADRVLIWLGPDPLNLAATTFKIFFKFANTVSMDLEDIENIDSDALLNLLEAESAEWTKHIEAFSECSWFDRLWVVQELVLSKRALALWGESEIDWKHVDTAIGLIFLLNTTRTFNTHFRLVRIVPISTIGHDYKEHSLELLPTMRLTKWLNCKDARDKIYAILGLFSDSQIDTTLRLVDAIQVDYTKSVKEVYEEFAFAAAELGLAGELLSQLRHLPTLEDWTEGSVASWVPTWTQNQWTRTYGSYPALFSLTGQENTLHFKERRLYGSSYHVSDILKVSETIDMIDYKVHSLLKPILDFWQAHVKSQSNFESGSNRDINCEFTEALMEGSNVVTGTFEPGNTFQPLQVWLEGVYQNSKLMESWPKESRAMMQDIIQSFKDSFGGPPTFPDQSFRDHWYTKFYQYLPRGKRLFKTTTNRIGRGPAATRPGDVVRFLPGAESPMVLRPQGDFYQVVGHCYVARLMDLEPEGLKEFCRGLKMEQIEIK